jgi:hypothetical protein
MGAVAIAAGVAALSAFLAGLLIGHNGAADDRHAHQRQIVAARDAVMKVAVDMRTAPHTKLQLEEVLPLLAERTR